MDQNVWANDLIAIEMVDLLEITRLNLPQSWGLKSLNLMSVQRVEELSFIQGVQDGAFNLDALKTAGSIEMAGLWTRYGMNSQFPPLSALSNSHTMLTLFLASPSPLSKQ
jgi:hypothetical protein